VGPPALDYILMLNALSGIDTHLILNPSPL